MILRFELIDSAECERIEIVVGDGVRSRLDNLVMVIAIRASSFLNQSDLTALLSLSIKNFTAVNGGDHLFQRQPLCVCVRCCADSNGNNVSVRCWLAHRDLVCANNSVVSHNFYFPNFCCMITIDECVYI